MADAAARREARRRKILENSKNRLKLITGENTELNNDVDHQVVNNDSTIIQNNEIETFLVNATKCLQQQQQQLHHHQHQHHEIQSNNELELGGENFPIQQLLALNENIEIETAASTQSTYNSNNNDLKSWPLYTKKLFIVFVAIVIRLLFIFQMQFCVRDSIIYPFIIAEVTLQFLNKDNVENVSPLLGTALMFSNLPSVQINRFLRTLRIFETFIQDFSLYFFTFLTVHLCLTAVI